MALEGLDRTTKQAIRVSTMRGAGLDEFRTDPAHAPAAIAYAQQQLRWLRIADAITSAVFAVALLLSILGADGLADWFDRATSDIFLGAAAFGAIVAWVLTAEYRRSITKNRALVAKPASSDPT